ncbi:low temperature requirement protein A [Lentzea flaviverrucosa]|uniref:Low temperature requirement protein LtrA n=1 Tax=Lentzea flaviverrucosa TaxID=200379 RepID=A0A1H9SQ59_9PSEU|nr:low temperature requirement protein A [Lentzea flaviverrucosa]RDI25469.1 low temperature requirement protein LtrA [Lentzea flaviverrucosa]SER87071.1 Low temperature requirement protein LtrA [Lentzea flaviverrucosa]
MIKKLLARDTAEAHRVATPLELLFDLSFVVAVAQAAASLHHAVSENHAGTGLLAFCMAFFALWLPWLNFTWFSSAFDNDDTLYRIITMVQIAGVLVIAAGIPAVFEHQDYRIVVGGYVVIRLAMVTHWLRAARDNPEHKACAYRYAGGIAAMQVLWVLWLFVPPGLALAFWVLGMVTELLIPAWAERASATTWHPHHIAERHGLFTLIVLGESILAATLAFQKGFDSGVNLISLAAASLVIVFSVWWIYFEAPSHLLNLKKAFLWGYAHLFILGSIAALGAGLAASVDYDLHISHAPGTTVAAFTTVPLAVFFLCVWYVQDCPGQDGLRKYLLPIGSVAVLAATFGPAPIHVTAGISLLLAVATRLVSGQPQRTEV